MISDKVTHNDLFSLEILLLCAKCLTLLYSPSFLKLWLVKFQASPFTGLEAQDQDIGDFFFVVRKRRVSDFEAPKL